MSEQVTLDQFADKLDAALSAESPGLQPMDHIRRMPNEVQELIYDFAGTLTKLLHGRLALPLDKYTLSLAIADCFDQDAVDKVGMIPGSCLSWEVVLLRSNAMKEASQGHFQFNGRMLDLLDDLHMKCPGESVLCIPQSQVDALGQLMGKAIDEMLRNSIDFLSDHIYKDAIEKIFLSCLAVSNTRAFKKITKLLIDYLTPDHYADPGSGTASNDVGPSDSHEPVINCLSPMLAGNAVRCGNLDFCRAIVAKCPKNILIVEPDDICQCLILGQKEIIVWLMDTVGADNLMFAEIRDIAAALYHLDLLDYCTKNNFGSPISQRAMDLAAKYGKMRSIIWLHERGYTCTTDAVDWASENGHYEIVGWLIEHRYGCTHNAIHNASKNGHVAIVKLLVASQPKYRGHNAMVASAEQGHIEIFRLLWDAYPDQRPTALEMCDTARFGRLFIIIFFIENTNCSKQTIHQMMYMMRMEKYYHEANCLYEYWIKTPKQ